MKRIITGLKRFTGNVDGKNIVSGNIFVQCRLDDSRNGADQFASGTFTETYRVGPDLIKRIEHIPTPFSAELDIERVGNGREGRDQVVDVRPLDLVKVPASKAA